MVMAYSAQQQSGMYYARRRRQARLLLSQLTPWSSGLVVSQGQLVSSENGTSAYQAQNSGTTGATAPTGRSVNDGAVEWVKFDTLALLQYLNSALPTPA
jgi:hypothetical protein